jgi:hypothetical protein
MDKEKKRNIKEKAQNSFPFIFPNRGPFPPFLGRSATPAHAPSPSPRILLALPGRCARQRPSCPASLARSYSARGRPTPRGPARRRPRPGRQASAPSLAQQPRPTQCARENAFGHRASLPHG